MELHRIQSPTVSSIPRSVLLKKPFLSGPNTVKLQACQIKPDPVARKLKFLDFRARASGTTKIKSQAQDVSTTPSGSGQTDGNLVFVAGATGRVGSRTVRELLKLGFKVRAGVRSVQRAESLVRSVENMKLEDVAGGTKPIDKFELVECDLEKPDRIKPAIGNSSIVICCIGASEKEIFDITGPYRIDYQATKNLIDAATSAKTELFILLTSLGTNKVGFPAAILNLFWGVLLWKRKAEEALIASGLPYAIVRPGGMERPTDSYKETHNITLSEEDTLFGGQVSNLQVAELMAFMAKNRSLSCCKVVEVIAETSAPLTPLGELLKKIPSQREDICSFKESDDADGSKPVVSESTSVEKKPELIAATKKSPSSPYIAYEDLKPPTSPTPTPSTGSSGPVKASKIEITPPVEVNSSETSSISTDDVVLNRKHASSPYINYEDLKPPSSPTPTPSVGGSKNEPSISSVSQEVTPPVTDGSIDVEKSGSTDAAADEQHSKSSKGRPLSPFTIYEDLKPPTSPTPTPSNGSGGPVKATKIEITPPVEVNSSETSSISTDDVVLIRKHASSPYINYEDLKPPSSPTPTPSVGGSKYEPLIASVSQEVTSPLIDGNIDVAKSGSTDAAADEHHSKSSKGRPLSPFTMYEDLKPPSSPSPSSPKL